MKSAPQCELGFFVNIRWLEGPELGILAGVIAISGTVLIELFTLRERGREEVGEMTVWVFDALHLSLSAWLLLCI